MNEFIFFYIFIKYSLQNIDSICHTYSIITYEHNSLTHFIELTCAINNI